MKGDFVFFLLNCVNSQDTEDFKVDLIVPICNYDQSIDNVMIPVNSVSCLSNLRKCLGK